MRISLARRAAPILLLTLLLTLVGCTNNSTSQGVGPLVTISSPRNGDRVMTGETIDVVAVASDSVTPIQRIELWVDGVLVGDSSTPSNEQLHQFTATQDWVFEEAHSAKIEAFAYNLNNERSPVAEITLQVDGLPPTTATTAPTTAQTEPTATAETTIVAALTEGPSETLTEVAATVTPESITVLGRVTAQPGVNVRSGPGANSTRLGGVFTNNEVVAVGRTEVGDWVKIRYEGSEGWVVARFVQWASDVALLPVVNE